MKKIITIMPHKSEGIILSEKEKFDKILTAGKIQDSNVQIIPVGKSGKSINWVIKNKNDSPISVEILKEVDKILK